MTRAPFDPRPVTLEGRHVRLEPLAPSHAASLVEACGDDPAFRFMPVPPLTTLDAARAMIADAIAATDRGHEVAFAIVERTTGRAVGSTRFLDLQPVHRGLEIGWTWIGAAWRRTPVNTECKLLLLAHAFEDLGAHRVTLKTDARNEASQRAVLRIGGVREGVLRRHRVCWDGFVRDTVYFGITDLDWPSVKPRLTSMAGR